MTIAEVGNKYEMSADTLRYYEKAGLILDVQRKESGIRDYSEEDCRKVEFVKCMRSAGLSIEVLAEYMALFKEGDSSIEKRKNLLIEQRKILLAKMESMQNTLARLDYKISNYETVNTSTKIK